MSKQARVGHPICNLLPTEIEGFDSLAELALDMHWSWNHGTDAVWRQLDPELWAITHNPGVALQTVSRDRIERMLADPVFRENVDGLVEVSRQTGAGARGGFSGIIRRFHLLAPRISAWCPSPLLRPPVNT